MENHVHWREPDRPLHKPANPGPLGLISFGLTTLILGLYECGIGLPGSNPLGHVGPDQVIFGVAVFFGGMAQFVAGVLAFATHHTLESTIHCSYGAFWLAFAMLMVPSLHTEEAYAGNKHAYSIAVGIFLIAWCALTIIFFLAAIRTNIALLTVLGMLVLAFLLLGVAQFVSTTLPSSAEQVNQAGGAFAIFSAVAALYTGGAGLINAESTGFDLPLGQFTKTAAAEKEH